MDRGNGIEVNARDSKARGSNAKVFVARVSRVEGSRVEDPTAEVVDSKAGAEGDTVGGECSLEAVAKRTRTGRPLCQDRASHRFIGAKAKYRRCFGDKRGRCVARSRNVCRLV